MAEIREPNRVKDYLNKGGRGSKLQHQYDGTNRRAISLLPEPKCEQSSALPGSQYRNRQQLLLAIEANKSTGCVKVISNKQKSRGALLIFQGRLLGAMYGSSGVQGTLFYDDAFNRLLVDMSDPDTVVSAYALPESLVISTGALFHGQFQEVQQRGGVSEGFHNCFRVLTESRMPGCIMISDSNNVAILSVYMFAGKVVGLYSGKEGWLPANAQDVFQRIASHGGVAGGKIKSAVLQMLTMDDVFNLTTSLTRAGEEGRSAASNSISDKDLAELKNLDKESQSSRFVKNRNSKDPLSERELFLREHLSHLVNP
jgi:hypothetical protein